MHRVDDVDGVSGTGELAGEVDGAGEAAVGEGGAGLVAVRGEAHWDGCIDCFKEQSRCQS